MLSYINAYECTPGMRPCRYSHLTGIPHATGFPLGLRVTDYYNRLCRSTITPTTTRLLCKAYHRVGQKVGGNTYSGDTDTRAQSAGSHNSWTSPTSKKGLAPTRIVWHAWAQRPILSRLAASSTSLQSQYGTPTRLGMSHTQVRPYTYMSTGLISRQRPGQEF